MWTISITGLNLKMYLPAGDEWLKNVGEVSRLCIIGAL